MPETPGSPNVSLRSGPVTARNPQPAHEADAAVLMALDTLRQQGREAGIRMGDDDGYAAGIKFALEEVKNLLQHRRSGQPGNYAPKAPTVNALGDQASPPTEAPGVAHEPLPVDETALRAALREKYEKEHNSGYGVGYRRSFGTALHAAAGILNQLDESWQAGRPKGTSSDSTGDFEAETRLGKRIHR